MAKILCAISGIQFNVDHFPISLHSRECYHPIFVVEQKKLLQFTKKWAAHELTDTDSYLYFLALLNSTELVEWRVPAQKTSLTTSIVANNMESLLKLIAKFNIIKHPGLVLSRIAITPETKSLENVHYWISNWESSIADFEEGYITRKQQEKICVREATLERLIKDVNKPVSHYAKNLAEWAADAGDFPANITTYWKEIIIKCCKSESIFTISEIDLQDLIDHCEENIEHGSIYAHSLMALLREGKQKQKAYLGLGDIDITSSTYSLIQDNSSVEDANKQAMIMSAPTEKPSRMKYPSDLAYLRAKLRYEMAQKQITNSSNQTNGDN